MSSSHSCHGGGLCWRHILGAGIIFRLNKDFLMNNLLGPAATGITAACMPSAIANSRAACVYGCVVIDSILAKEHSDISSLQRMYLQRGPQHRDFPAGLHNRTASPPSSTGNQRHRERAAPVGRLFTGARAVWHIYELTRGWNPPPKKPFPRNGFLTRVFCFWQKTFK